MKHALHLILCAAFALSYTWLSAQTFNGVGGLLVPPGAPIQTQGITISDCEVTGVGIIGDGCTHIENVTIDFQHTFVGDVAVFIIAPSGEVLELSSGNGGAGDNFIVTEFTDFASQFITMGSPPYNGSFKPEGRQQSLVPPFFNTNPLGTFTFANTFDGVNADGTWQLFINDYVAIDVGVLNAWSITFASGGGPAPEVDLGPDITICPGETVMLTADVDPGADNFSWSNGGSGQTISVNPVSDTEYIVTATNNGCIGTDTINVIINPNAVTVDAGPDVNICGGDAVDLHATGGGMGAIYSWSSGQSGSDITVSPAGTTVYTVTVTDGACMATDQVSVIVTPIPMANAGPDEVICEGEFLTLTGSGGTNTNQYSWSTGQTGQSISVSPGNTTTYTLTVTINGCSAEDEVEVTVVPAPVVSAGSDQLICLGSSIELEATGSPGTYTWSDGQTGTNIFVSPTGTTIYTVTVSDNGCEATDQVEVEVLEIFPDAGPDVETCQGELVVLTASGGIDYMWSNGENAQQISVSPGSLTTYFVTVTDAQGCTGVDDVVVSVNPIPVANAGIDQTICEGEFAELTASGGTGTNSYAWSTGDIGPTLLVSPFSDQIYTVTVSVNGCTDEDDVLVTVLEAPVADAGSDVTICPGQQTDLTATGGGTYSWSTGQMLSSVSVMPSVTSTYTVTVTNAAGCTDVDAVTVQVEPAPMADAGPDEMICAGEIAILTASGGTDYAWSTGDTGPTITVAPASTSSYLVTVTSATGCTDVDAVNVVVNPIPTANAGMNVFILPGETATLTATGGGTYLWSTGETMPSIMVMPAMTTTYSVTVTLNGCSAVDDVTVFVNEVPDVSLGPDITICLGESATLDATIAGPFNLSYDWSNGDTNPTTTVTPVSDTAFSVTVSDIASGFMSVDTVLVTVIDIPIGQVSINGTTSFCAGDTVSYSSNQVLYGELYTWAVPAGATILSGQGTQAIEVDWGSVMSGQVSLVVSNSCGTQPAVLADVTINAAPVLVGPVNGPLSPCNLSTATYSIAPATNASAYQWTYPVGVTLVSGQGTASITINWNGLSGGDICVSAFNTCGSSAEICTTVTTLDLPTADAGPDAVVCGTTQMLAAQGVGVWNVVSGSGAFSDTNSPSSTFTSDNPGIVTLEWQVLESGCEAQDTVMIEFLDAPVLTEIDEDCNAFNTGYVVSFNITGGASPYSVNGSALAGSNFSSAEIPAGDPYQFVVTDAAGCTAEISATVSCNCTSSAGTMDQAPINGCIDGAVQATFSGGEILDGNDILAFALHDGSFPGGILAWNTIPEFQYQPGIIPGQTYFISAVAGNASAGQIPDVNDPCLAVAIGTPVIFNPLPTAIAAGDTEIGCAPATATLDGSLSGAGLNFLWKTTDGKIEGDPAISMAIASQPGTYILEVTDQTTGCINRDTLILTGHTISTSSLLLIGTGPVCQDACDGVLDTEGPADWEYALNGGTFGQGTFSDLCAGAYILTIRDSQGCTFDTTFAFDAPDTFSVNLGPDKTIKPREVVDIEAVIQGDFTDIHWTVEACDGCPTLTVSPVVTTEYVIEVTDAKGCVATDAIVIKVLPVTDVFVPNVFSPNYDNRNDVVEVVYDPAQLTITQFDIFNRWGGLVFSSPPDQIQTAWDGLIQGKMAEPGVFVYHLRALRNDGTPLEQHGTITLVR